MDGILSVIFTPGFANSILRMSTPLIFVSMAAVIGARADILSIAYEGIMLFAALGGVLASAYSKSLIGGLLGALLAGGIISAVYAYFVLKLKTKPMLIGLALNILGSAGTVYILYLVTGSKSHSIGLPSLVFPEVNIPLLKDIPIIGEIFSGHNLLTYLAFVSVFLVHGLIYKTPLGLRIRSVGENPDVAKSVGIDEVKVKFTAMMISGVLASLGGAYMTMGYLPYFTRDITSGRGFIGIAAQSLGQGQPIFTMLYTLVFGAAESFGNIAQSFRMPSQFAAMLPYVATLVGLVLMNVRTKKPPKAKDTEHQKDEKNEKSAINI